MGDRKTIKHAVIICGDKEARHIKNVERAARVLKKSGYKVYVASPKPLSFKVDAYVKPTRQKVGKLIDGIKSDDDDEVVIYGTGHGKDRKEICLQDGCVRDEIINKLDAIKYGRRTVVLDTCYAGNIAKRFTDDPKTLFVAAGPKDTIVCCGNFAPVFWMSAAELMKRGADTNNDKNISMQERYAAAYKKHPGETRLFIPSKGYIDFDLETGKTAKPNFPAEPVVVKTPRELAAQKKRLKAGEYRIIAFSMEGCLACDEYWPKFKKMAKAAGGRHLFIWAKSDELRTKYGIKTVPHVIIIDKFGNKKKVINRNEIFKSLANFNITAIEASIRYIKHYFKTKQSRKSFLGMALALINIAEYSGKFKASERKYLIATLSKLLDQKHHKAIRQLSARILGKFKSPSTVPALSKALKREPLALIRKDLLIALANIKDRRVTKILISTLKDKHPGMRALAAAYLASTKDPSAIKPLIDLMNDGYSIVRMTAARALGILKAKAAVPVLIKALAKTDFWNKAYIVAALGMIGDKRAFKPLLKILGSKWPPNRITAAWSLAQLKDPRAIKHIVPLLKKDEFYQEKIFRALAMFEHREANTVLLRALKSKNVYTKINVAKALSDVKTKDPKLIAQLITMLADPDGGVRYNVERAILNAKHPWKLSYLLCALANPSNEIKVAAIKILAKLKNPLAVSGLADLLKSKNDEVRQHAATALSVHPNATKVLIAALRHKDWKVRTSAVWGLGESKDPKAKDYLISRLKIEKDENVRMTLIRALGEMKAKKAVPVLLDLLKTIKQDHISTPIILALGKIGDKRAVPLLMKLFRKKDATLKMVTLSALVIIDDRKSIDTAIGILNGGDAATRKFVKSYLKQINDPRIRKEAGRIKD